MKKIFPGMSSSLTMSNVLSNFVLNHIHSYPLPQLHEARGPIAEHHYMCVSNHAKILQFSLNKSQHF